jgi:hypothetical protein
VSKIEGGHVAFNTIHHGVELVLSDLMHKSLKQGATLELVNAHLPLVVVNGVEVGVG